MKAKINYKSRKTIIIIAIAAILLIAAIAGTVAFIKGNNEAAAAMPENSEQAGSDNQGGNGTGTPAEGENGNENQGQTELPPVNAGENENNPTTGDNNGTANNGTTTGNGTTNNGATGTQNGTTGNNGTGTTLPDQEYTQTTTVITENPWETRDIGWSPLTVTAYTAAARLGINKPDLSTEKLAYVSGDSLENLPVNTAIQKGEVITYVIKVTNNGKVNANLIRTLDTIPTGTELVENSITEGGVYNANTKTITWKNNIEAGKTVELSFKVNVVADSVTIVENTAKVNGDNTPTTINPVITSAKTAQIVVTDEAGNETLENRDAKVGETIRYTINVTNKSDVEGITTITDKIPTGTILVEGSITNGGEYDEATNTITWKNVKVSANGASVSFDVTVNADTKTSVTNVAIVGDTETPEVETKVANITGGKSVDKTEAKVGDTLTYTITLTNSGNADGKVTVTDEIPEGTTLVENSISNNGTVENGTITWNDVEVKAHGGTATLTLKVVVNENATTVKNVAKIDDKDIPEKPETSIADITTTKVVKSVNGNEANVDTVLVKAGDVIEYQIKVKNTGSVTLKNVKVTESLNVYLNAEKPEETTKTVAEISEIKAGEEKAFTVYYKVTDADVANVDTDLVNVATATGSYTDENGTEQTVEDDGTVTVSPTERKDLSIVKSQKVNGKDVAKNQQVVPNDEIEYTIVVKNTGNTVLNNIEVTDSMLTNPNFTLTNRDGFTLTNGKLTIASLAIGETKTITAKYTVQESDMKEEVGTIANTATAKAEDVPEEPSTVEVPTEAWYADINTVKESEGKHADGSAVTAENPLHELDTITYKLIATNTGKKAGTVKIADKVPAGTTLVANSIKIGNTTYTEEQLNNGIDVELKAGETKTLTFVVTVNPFETEKISVVNNEATQDGEKIPGTTDEVEKEYVSVTVTKTWIDNETQANRRPSKIKFELYADNNTTAVDSYEMSTEKNNSYTFDKLSKYNQDGTTIKYTVQEKELNTGDLKFYTSSMGKNDPVEDTNGNRTYNFTNTFTVPQYTKSVPVIKVWDDNNNAAGKRPTDSVTLELNGESVELTAADASNADGNKWYKILEKPVYNENGEEIVYTLTENNVPQWYESSVNNEQYKVTNTFKAPTDQKHYITITKVWDDNSNTAGKRPTSITLTLNKIDVTGNTVKVKDVELTGDSTAKQWTATENVQKYDEKANEIQYFVVEESTGSIFYVNTDTNKTDLTVTNKFEVPADKADITVRKVWNDNNNASKRTPVIITVTGGENNSTRVTLTSTNALTTDGNIWESKVTTLPKYDSLGNEIIYTVDEPTVPTGYIKTPSTPSKAKDGEVATITNSLPGIQVTKDVISVTDKNGNKTDTVGVDQITVNEGDVIEYKITVTNLGTVDLTNVTVTDNLNVYTDKLNPENTTKTLLENGTLKVGEPQEFTVYYKVTADDVKVAKQVLKNTAIATGDYNDSTGNTQHVTDDDFADVTIADVPGINIVKTQLINGAAKTADTKVKPGDVITYTITVTNTGNTVLNNVVVTDSMSEKAGFTITSGSLNIGTLEIGGTRTITATYTVLESDMSETVSTVENIATVTTSTTEPGDSTVDVPTEEWKADIDVTKSSKLIKQNSNSVVTVAEYGDTIKYTITATNKGKKAGTINVKDTIPAGTELIPFANNDTNLTQTELDALDTEDGLTKKLNVPGATDNGYGTTSIYFTVKVVAKPGEDVTNTATLPDKPEDNERPDNGNKVEKQVSVRTKTEVPTITNSNVVIVLDVSGSMNYKLNQNSHNNTTRLDKAKDVVQSFINTINFPEDGSGSSVSVVTFSGPSYGNTSGTGYTKVLSVDSQGNTIANTRTEADYLADTSVENVTANGGTCISGALKRATEQVNSLKTAKPQNQNIVIFVGDGKPDGDSGNIAYEAGELKKTGAIVYSIGFTQDVEALRTIASVDENGRKLYYKTDDNLDLSEVFQKIGNQIASADPAPIASEGGMVKLTNIDISKDITIRVKASGATNPVEKTGNYNKPQAEATDNDKYIQSKITHNEDGEYYLDLTKFEADDTIEIDYFVVENQA